MAVKESTMQVAQCLTEELSLTNCAVVSEKDLQSGLHVTVKTTPNQKYVFTVKTHHTVAPGTIAFNLPQRKWAGLSIGQEVEVSNYNFESKQCIGAMTIEMDFLQKKSTDSSPYDSDRMAFEFIQQFNNQAFSVTQQLVFYYMGKLFGLVVKDIEAMDAGIFSWKPATGKKQQKIDIGLMVGNSQVIFEKAENSSLTLVGRGGSSLSRASQTSLSPHTPSSSSGGTPRRSQASRETVSPTRPRSASRPSPGGTCPEYLPREASRGHPK